MEANNLPKTVTAVTDNIGFYTLQRYVLRAKHIVTPSNIAPRWPINLLILPSRVDYCVDNIVILGFR